MSFAQMAAAGGGVISAAGSIVGGIAAKNQSSYEAQVARYDAQIADANASNDAAAQARKSAQVIGGIRAGYGASGVQQDSGTPLDVLAQSARGAELDRQTILYKGRLRALQFQDQAALDEYQGDQAMTSSYFNAASSILKGGSSAYQMGESSSSMLVGG